MRKFLVGRVGPFAVAVLLASYVWAEKFPFERYQTIVDRQPFGEPPPNFDPSVRPEQVKSSDRNDEAQLTQEQQQLSKSVSFSVINVEEDGAVWIGFTDNSNPKVPRHHYMKVGTTEDGWTVKEANASSQTMTVEKDGVEVALSLGGKSDGKAPAVSADQRTDRSALAGAPNGGVRSNLMRPGSVGLMGRRAQRLAEEAEKRNRSEQAAKEAAALQAAKEAEQAAKEAEEKEQRDREREEHRRQILKIQEELKLVRENREREKAAEASADSLEVSE